MQTKTEQKKINNKTFGGSPSLIVITIGKEKILSFIFTPHFLIYCCVLCALQTPNPKPKRVINYVKNKSFLFASNLFVFFSISLFGDPLKKDMNLFQKSISLILDTDLRWILLFEGFFLVMDNAKSVNITTDLLLE